VSEEAVSLLGLVSRGKAGGARKLTRRAETDERTGARIPFFSKR
jgi:hypothetical protein